MKPDISFLGIQNCLHKQKVTYFHDSAQIKLILVSANQLLYRKYIKLYSVDVLGMRIY